MTKEKEDNTVVSLADKKKELEKKKKQAKLDRDIETIENLKADFAEIMKSNKDKKEREKKERDKANRSVLRSYRLKTDKDKKK